jgi:predicted RNase H-like nuclease
VTQDIDLWFENLTDEQLRAALGDVGATYVPQIGLNPPMFAGGGVELFDIVLTMSGLESFAEELEHCVDVALENIEVKVLSLERILASKRAANRSKDRLVIPVLEDTLFARDAVGKRDTHGQDTRETTLLVGFDSAWTAANSGALVGALYLSDGTFQSLGLPQAVNFAQATEVIQQWQSASVTQTIILLDQPTVVTNKGGQRPVENIVGNPVGRRHGGVQPSNTGKLSMFGPDAPVWPFVRRFGLPQDPLTYQGRSQVIETYPVLTMIALGWTMDPAGRLPKYNPRRPGFSLADWQFVCEKARIEIEPALPTIGDWLRGLHRNPDPGKRDQDYLDACICLIVAIHLVRGHTCMMVGNRENGYMVVPFGERLWRELELRCKQTGLRTEEWVRLSDQSLAPSKQADSGSPE